MDNQHIGSYVVSVDSEQFKIFPKNRYGVTIPVTVIRHNLTLQHAVTRELVVFKRFLHMKKWYWNDSRVKGPCHESHVLSEVARLIGDEERARSILIGMLLAA